MRREYTLAELAEAVGMSERNVRAYRSRGLIRPPRLKGRTGYYGFDHLTQLRLVQALTGRGLTLAVVTQLVQRGLAQNQLSRMIRDEMPSGPAVDMSSVVVHELEQSQPGLLDALVAHGLGRRTSDGYESDPNLLALANQLANHGVPGVEISRICLAGAEAAGATVAQIGVGLAAPRNGQPLDVDDVGDGSAGGEGGGHAEAVAVELATTAFRLALEVRLSRPER